MNMWVYFEAVNLKALMRVPSNAYAQHVRAAEMYPTHIFFLEEENA